MRDMSLSGLYYKHITIVNEDRKWCHNFKDDYNSNWQIYKHITIIMLIVVNDASAVTLQIVASLAWL